MRLFTAEFVQRWYGKMLNIHPSLLPSFPGLDPHGQALNAGVKISGATVHFVIPETDAGPIVMQGAVAVADDDTRGDAGAAHSRHRASHLSGGAAAARRGQGSPRRRCLQGLGQRSAVGHADLAGRKIARRSAGCGPRSTMRLIRTGGTGSQPIDAAGQTGANRGPADWVFCAFFKRRFYFGNWTTCAAHRRPLRAGRTRTGRWLVAGGLRLASSSVRCLGSAPRLRPMRKPRRQPRSYLRRPAPIPTPTDDQLDGVVGRDRDQSRQQFPGAARHHQRLQPHAADQPGRRRRLGEPRKRRATGPGSRATAFRPTNGPLGLFRR